MNPLGRVLAATMGLAIGQPLSSQASVFPPELVTFDPYAAEAMLDSTTVRKFIHYEGGSSSVTLSTHRQDPVTGDWSERESSLYLGFRLTDVAHRDGGTRIYASGIDDAGVDIIKVFEFREQDPGSSSASGSTASNGDPSREVPQETVLFRGKVGHVRALEVDPEGRFLLALHHKTSKLFRIDLAGPGPYTPQLFLSVAQEPWLLQVQSMSVYDHPDVAIGRMWVLQNDPLATTYNLMALVDVDGDGAFDRLDRHTEADFESSLYSDTALWIDLAEE